jgi:hypothetical protein
VIVVGFVVSALCFWVAGFIGGWRAGLTQGRLEEVRAQLKRLEGLK